MEVSSNKQIIANFEKTIPRLTLEDQEKLLAFSEGVALAAGYKLEQQPPQPAEGR